MNCSGTTRNSSHTSRISPFSGWGAHRKPSVDCWVKDSTRHVYFEVGRNQVRMQWELTAFAHPLAERHDVAHDPDVLPETSPTPPGRGPQARSRSNPDGPVPRRRGLEDDAQVRQQVRGRGLLSHFRRLSRRRSNACEVVRSVRLTAAEKPDDHAVADRDVQPGGNGLRCRIRPAQAARGSLGRPDALAVADDPDYRAVGRRRRRFNLKPIRYPIHRERFVGR